MKPERERNMPEMSFSNALSERYARFDLSDSPEFRSFTATAIK